VHEAGPQLVFAGGGTGGHLYPALAVAAELRRRHPQGSIWFIGARRGIEQTEVPRAGYPLRTLSLSGMQGRSHAARIGAVGAAGWAVVRCLTWLAAARPDLVIGVGGYASGPAMLAAILLRRRTMVLEQNHYPGATNRWLAPRVDVVCVPSEAARERLGGRGLVTGNPVREEFASIGEPPLGATRSVLAFGGSRGARSINAAMIGAIDVLAHGDPPPRICHQTGTSEYEQVRAAARAYPGAAYEVLPFLHDMPARLAAADLAVCRAGASTLSELAVAGRAAILVPYPFAADDHQRHNAETLERAGAAVTIRDADLDGPRLGRAILELTAERERLSAMGRAARALGRPDATRQIADAAERLVGTTVRSRGVHVP